MNDKKQVKLLKDAITLYEDGAILEAGDKASEFINAITDFLDEETAEEVTGTEELVPIGSLTLGTVVEAGGIQVEILDMHYPTSEGGEGVFCIAKDIAFCKAFDDGNLNNWTASSLREYLNEKFKDKLIEKIGEDALLTFERDLTSDDGLKMYENCIDTISLISCGEYRKYHQHISDKDIWWWTLTADSVPIFTHSPRHSQYAAYGRSRYVRIVRSDGSLTNSDAYCGYFGVVPVLCLLSSLNVVVV